MNDLPPDVVAFLKANAPDPLVGESELTVVRAAKEWGISEALASSKLERLVDDGKLVKEPRRGKNRRPTFAYVVVKRKS